jgi:hypothetical protein
MPSLEDVDRYIEEHGVPRRATRPRSLSGTSR